MKKTCTYLLALSFLACSSLAYARPFATPGQEKKGEEAKEKKHKKGKAKKEKKEKGKTTESKPPSN